MLVMRTSEYPADPLGEFVSAKKPIGLYNPALAVNPLGLYGVKPRTLLRQKTAYDPHPASALFDTAVMSSEPAPELPGDVPGSVVPDEQQNLLTDPFELLHAPLKELGGYGTDGPAINEAHPHLAFLGQVESVAGDGFRLGIIFSDRPLSETKRLALLGPTAQGGQGQRRLHQSTPHRNPPPRRRRDLSQPRSSVGRAAFFLWYRGSGEVIHLLALSHPTPSRRAKVARTVSPETRLSVSPSLKAASEAISKVQRLESYPNSLGDRWSISLKVSALYESKAPWTRLGREEPATSSAPCPCSLKACMAFLSVCEPHPRDRAIFAGESPRELARSIWHRRITKSSFWSAAPLRGSRAPLPKANVRILEFSWKLLELSTHDLL